MPVKTATRRSRKSEALAVVAESALQEKIKQQKKDLIEALWDNKGIIQKAVGQAGLSRSTYYEYYNGDPEFKRAADEAQDVALDHVEGKLHELIDGVEMVKYTKDGPVVYERPPDTVATIFYLKTKGKKRGYVEKLEIDAKVDMHDPESPESQCQRFVEDLLKVAFYVCDSCNAESDKGTLNCSRCDGLIIERRATLEQAYDALMHHEGIEESVKVRFVEAGRKMLG